MARRRGEIPSSEKDKKVDQLASRLQEALADLATATRPIKPAQVRILDLVDKATREKVAAAW